MKIVIIAQARTGSARLPGKVLKPLGGKTVVEHVLTRARASKLADAAWLATTTEASDDAVNDAGHRLGVPVFRGSERDVLGRYAGAAAAAEADVIVRITCDCPLIDPGVIDSLIALFRDRSASYAWNDPDRDWPVGLDCEVFSREMLDRAAAATTNDFDREHVTPWIRDAGARTKVSLAGPGGPVSKQRWVLDYPEDYEFLLRLFDLFPGREPPLRWQDVWTVVEKHSSLHAVNAHLR